MIVLGTALAAPCPFVATTREAYEPGSAGVRFEDAAGNRDRMLEGLPPHRRALFDLYKSDVRRYTAAMQAELVAGRVPVSADEVALTLARGEPDAVWETGDGCRALLHVVDTTEPTLFVACDAAVQQAVPLRRGISCEVLTRQMGRVAEDPKLFRSAPVWAQLDVVAWHRGPDLDEELLELGFGGKRAPETGDPLILKVVDVPEPVAPVDRVEPLVSDEAVAAALPVAQAGDPSDDAAAPRAVMLPESTSRGQFAGEVHCGERTMDIEVELGASYAVRATERPGDGDLVRWVSRGIPVRTDAGETFAGIGTAVDSDTGGFAMTLAGWPVETCDGVVLEATSR